VCIPCLQCVLPLNTKSLHFWWPTIVEYNKYFHSNSRTHTAQGNWVTLPLSLWKYNKSFSSNWNIISWVQRIWVIMQRWTVSSFNNTAYYQCCIQVLSSQFMWLLPMNMSVAVSATNYTQNAGCLPQCAPFSSYMDAITWISKNFVPHIFITGRSLKGLILVYEQLINMVVIL
jgi:hypothetical protein